MRRDAEDNEDDGHGVERGRVLGQMGESVSHVSTSSHVRRLWQRRGKRPLPKASNKQTPE